MVNGKWTVLIISLSSLYTQSALHSPIHTHSLAATVSSVLPKDTSTYGLEDQESTTALPAEPQPPRIHNVTLLIISACGSIGNINW